MAHFQALERLINLNDGYQKIFEVGGHSILLIHENNRSHLFLNRCPHQGKALGPQCLQKDKIRCPWHGLEFNLDSGRCLNPQHNLGLQKLQISYEAQFLGVILEGA